VMTWRALSGRPYGVAAVIFALAPILTLGGAAIVIWNLDGKALGAAAGAYTRPLLNST